MSTLTTTSSGLRVCQFRLSARSPRQTITIGRVRESTAKMIQGHVDNLVAHRITGEAIPRQTAAWLADIQGKLKDRLVRTGLLSGEPKAGDAISLGSFLERYIEGRTDLKPGSKTNLAQVKNSLIGFFGSGRDIATITRGDGGDWHRRLKCSLSPATVAAFVKKSRQMLKDAVDRKLISDNPLSGIKAGKMSNPERQRYVPPAVVNKVINACPNIEWSLMFALARFGGLRVPSETRALRWADVHWDEGRMTVRSPKTEHHQGRAYRQIPIFSEIEPLLREALEKAQPGATHVITVHRTDNPRTTAEKILDRAGVKQWPRLFQNLRSSFETDLTAKFPLHVCCAWAGNTEAVALSHYLQVTDEHFDMALGRAANSAARGHETIEVETKGQTHKPSNFAGLHNLLALKMTPTGAAPRREYVAFLKALESALRRALEKLRIAAEQARSHDIDIITGELKAAKDVAAGGSQ